MTDQEWQLLQYLSRAEYCSGEWLGQQMGTTRAAIWKMVQGLRRQGFSIVSRSGQGYVLEQSMEWLDFAAIKAQLSPLGLAVQVLRQTVSTNLDMLQEFARGQGHAQVILAEQQTGGRGRRGRSWLSPLAHNFYGSLGWRFDRAISALAGLSLAVGVAVAQVLEPVVGRTLGLKWPNDIMLDQGKLGGILIELNGDVSGPCDVIIGLGLNHRGFTVGVEPDQPSQQLDRYVQLERTALSVLLVQALRESVLRFEQGGLTGFVQEFERRDVLRDKSVKVQQAGSPEWYGWGRGIAADGSLLLERQGQLITVNSGEVSVRVAAVD